MNKKLLYLAGLLNENKLDDEKSTSKVLHKNLEFFKKRRAGAAKIAKTAHEKGGPSILTFYHFDAKDKQYEDVLKAIESGQGHEFFKSKYDSLMNKLHKTKFEQEPFQRVIGELEVWGEAIAQLF